MDYINFRLKEISNDINTIFPGWINGDERVAVFAPHDDDALIGAGYAIEAAISNGGEVFAVIFCNGDCGYSTPGDKTVIVEKRRKETLNAHELFGIPKENNIYMGYPDFSAWQYFGYHLVNGAEGATIEIIKFIREHKITRVLIPNGYREHLDHESVFRMGAYDVIQAGDAVVTDISEPYLIRNILQYSVWADFSPEDALVSGAGDIRANRAILVPKQVEDKIYKALLEFKSQIDIIHILMERRKERITKMGYMELYIQYDPRPKLDFAPYKKLVDGEELKY